MEEKPGEEKCGTQKLHRKRPVSVCGRRPGPQDANRGRAKAPDARSRPPPADCDALVEAVTARLKEQRYLNDTSYATSYSANRRDTEKFGSMRVVQDLKAKGVHPDVIGKAIGETYSEVDEEKLACEFAGRKRLKQPKDQKQAARIFRMMARAGFSSRVIVKLLRNWKVEDETLSALEQEREMAEHDSFHRGRIVKPKPQPQSQPEWSTAVEHLSAADPKLAALIAQVGPCTIAIPHHFSIFYSLARSIVYQQLAGAAAASILARVEALFRQGRMTPKNLLQTPEAELRAAGLSQNKLAALRDLAAKCLDGTVPSKRALARMADEEIIERISQVRGIGRWTVEMMLIFRLGRPNVLPVDDYGVRKGMQRLYNLRELPGKDAMRRRARKWEPWCSVASWYLWRCAELPGKKAAAKNPAGNLAKKKAATKKAAKKKPAKKLAANKRAAKKKAVSSAALQIR